MPPPDRSSTPPSWITPCPAPITTLSFDVELALDPTAGNPLGIKGGGEAASPRRPAAVINALVDALREFGIDHVDMPATPMRVWAAIEGAKQGG
jgi:carbon-monoxide dehydrogenase large subunit